MIIRNKLKSQAGESIAETLIALLISALALMMLAGAISAANRMITQSREKMRDYYTINNSIIDQTAADKGAMKVLFKLVKKDTDGNVITSPVSLSLESSGMAEVIANYYQNNELRHKRKIKDKEDNDKEVWVTVVRYSISNGGGTT